MERQQQAPTLDQYIDQGESSTEGQDSAPVSEEPQSSLDPTILAQMKELGISTSGMQEPSEGASGQPDVASGQQGVTTQQAPATPGSGNDASIQAELQRQRQEADNLRGVLMKQANEAARREEEQFQQSLQNMDEGEAAQARLTRIQTVAQNRERYLQNQLASIQQQQTNAQEQMHKSQAAILIANERGLPMTPQTISALRSAETPAGMEAIADTLRGVVGQQQQPQEQRRNPVVVPESGGVTPQQPKRFSGDLDGLIGSRDWVVLS